MIQPYRFKLGGITWQIDSDGTVWEVGYRDALHMQVGPQADFILRHGRALQWIAQEKQTQ